LVQPHGAKLWRLKYRHGGRERVYAIGVYDEIGLAAARVERDRARQWVREGRDPTIERRVAKVRDSPRGIPSSDVGRVSHRAGFKPSSYLH
jgi:SRSO17 transposase